MAYRKQLTQKRARPVDVFRHCPRCDSRNVFAVDEDVFCNYCDWNSVAINVECSDPYYADIRIVKRSPKKSATKQTQPLQVPSPETSDAA